ncbi:MAG TPA: hypothetical protein VEG68_00055 [Terriglobales bacterium]|nr:hypothetical protein [Terriglobales bacterium]
MSDKEQVQRIKERISELVERRNNVTLEEIEWVVQRLGGFYPVASRDAKHGKLFNVGGRRFMVNCHNPGSKQVKPYSVDEFRDAMIDLGWYDS